MTFWARPAGARKLHFFAGVSAMSGCRYYYAPHENDLRPSIPSNDGDRCKGCARYVKSLP